MIRMTHNNDGKQKYQSYTVTIKEDNFYCLDPVVFSHNPFDITGYGETKEEAIRDFKRKFEYVMAELRAFETMLFETDSIIEGIVEVDCQGNEIKG